MFRLHRHRSERLGERVDFRFSSFQAFQIPKGWDRLVLSIVSVETGKTIAKANKATVRGGTCQWTEAFSESIWIPHDNASKKMEECLLKIVVSMGSHRSGILGDLTINLTDYLSSRDSGSLPLPLKNCNYGTLLQLRIQCLNLKRGFREVRSSRETSYLDGLHTNNDDADSKSDVSNNKFNRSVGSLSSNHPDGPINQDTSFSASGSHHSSDSGESAVGRLNFSPRNNSNGGSYMGRQDSAGSHISAASSAGPADDFSRSNPSSFNSKASGSSTPIRWQESMMQTSAPGLATISLRQSGSSKDFLEAAEETIEELQDEAKMWERHAQKLKQDVEKFRKECLDKTKRQAELDLELSAAYSDRNTLKQEVEQLKASLEEATTKQTATRASKNEVMLRVQKESEDEVKYLKESNANLNLQLNKSQEANLELVSILEELEETVEMQRLEIAKFSQQSPLSESEGDLRSQKLLDVEAEWKAKLSVKEKEIRKLEEKLSGKFNVEYTSENESSHGYPDLIEEIEELRGKVQELERDCAELTDENLELIYKMKQSGDDIRGEKHSENSDSEIYFLKSKIRGLEEEIRTKEMLNGGQAETSAIQMKNLEKKCSDLEVELQYFKDQACDLDGKLHDSQLEVEGKISELTELQKKLKSFDTVTALKETEEQERTNKEIVGNESDIEDLELAFSMKEKEIDILRHAKEELEVLVTNIQRDKCQLEENLSGALRESTITSECLDNVQHEMTLLASSVDSHTSTNKMLERKLMELESSKHELEVQVSELEEENVQLSERISGLEAQLRYLTNEKESNRLELEDSRSLVEDLKGEVAKQQTEIETQKGELKQKLLDAQKRLSETQEETEYLKRSHSKLQSTIESLIEENSLLQKSNGDLRRQKLDLHEHSACLEVELSEAQKRTSEFLKKVEILEVKLSSMQKDIVLKEKMLTSQLENIFEEHEDQEEKISQAKLALNQIDVQNTVLVENLKRENAHLSTQLCSTHDEQQRMASDAVLEVSGLRSDKIELESSLQEALAKIELYETELQFLKQESSKKVQGLVDLLNASKQTEETLMSDIENMQRQAEAAKSGDEEFKGLASERELKLKASDYEKQKIIEETSSLKVQVQKIVHLQDEILVLKSALEEVKFEKGKLEESLQSVYEECESLKTERVSFMEKISNMQKALHDGEDEKRSRIALEEKLLRLEGDLSAKEASYAHEAELKNEVNRIKRANNEYQRKIQCLEEKWELVRKAQVQKNGKNQDKIALDKCGVEKPSCEHHDKQSQIQDVEQLADADQTKIMDDSKLRDLESTIQDLEAKIWSLDSELAESVAENNLYKIQLQGLMAEKQSSNSEVPMVNTSVDDLKSQQSKVFSVEAELKDVQHTNKIAALEAELKDMRERYLHMSLQYAEVEAQREELVLKLKTTAKGKGWFS